MMLAKIDNGKMLVKNLEVNNAFDARVAISALEKNSDTSVKATAIVVKQIKEKELFKDIENCKSVTDYCKQVFGYSKAYTSYLVKVATRFLKDSTMSILADENNDFNFSQLRVLTALTDEQIKVLIDNGSIDVTMTVKELEAVVEKIKKSITADCEEAEAEAEAEANAEAKTVDAVYFKPIHIVINGTVEELPTEFEPITKDGIFSKIDGVVSSVTEIEKDVRYGEFQYNTSTNTLIYTVYTKVQ